MAVTQEQLFKSVFQGEEFFLKDHLVHSERILPGVAYLEMARAAAQALEDKNISALQDIVWLRPVIVNGQARELDISIFNEADRSSFEVKSPATGGQNSAVLHSKGRIIYGACEKTFPVDLEPIRAMCPWSIKKEEIYSLFKKQGLSYGPSFCSLQEIQYSDTHALAAFSLPQILRQEPNPFFLHPSIMDGALQTAMGLSLGESKEVINQPHLPFSLDELRQIKNGANQFDELNFFRAALDCQIPVISAMQGHAVGGGFVFGLYSDLVVLGRENIYTTNFMHYGFTPGLGATLIVAERLGRTLANELLYTANNYRGQELAQRGIPYPVVPKKEVYTKALELAESIADKPRLSLITLKNHLAGPLRRKLPLVITEELKMHEITFKQPEVAQRIETLFGQ